MLKKKIIIISAVGAVVVCALIGTIYIMVWNKSDIKEALDPKNYDTFQVVTTLKSEDMTDNALSTESVGSTAIDGYYVDSEGNLVSSNETTTDSSSNEAQPETIATTQKSGDIIYETGISGDYYFYSSEGKNYVLWYNTFYGIHKDGVWTQVPAEKLLLMLIV